jgi:hypothetical protein
VEVVSLLLFVGAIWGLCALGLFAWSLLNAQAEHTDRLAILPLEDNWTDPFAVPPKTAEAPRIKP